MSRPYAPAAPGLGDFAVVRTHGWQAAGIRLVTRAPVNHAILYVGGGQVIEGQPGGAALRPWNHYGDAATWARWPLEDARRQSIATFGRSLEGTPYNWIDDALIGLADLGVPMPWAARARLASPHHLECAQLVDFAYAHEGEHLFADGRYPGSVSPADLWRLIMQERTR